MAAFEARPAPDAALLLHRALPAQAALALQAQRRGLAFGMPAAARAQLRCAGHGATASGGADAFGASGASGGSLAPGSASAAAPPRSPACGTSAASRASIASAPRQRATS